MTRDRDQRMSDGFIRHCLESGLETPFFAVDEGALSANLEILDSVQQRTGAKVLLALKAFAMYSLAPRMMRHLRGVSAGSLHEAMLGREHFGGEVHTYSPAFKKSDMAEVIRCSDHVVFNSFSQLDRFRGDIEAACASGRRIEVGIRINPGWGEAQHEHYNPCRKGTRFGVPAEEIAARDLTGVTGLAFHALCESRSGPLAAVLDRVRQGFGETVARMRWMNFGGGHLITASDYDVDHLCSLIARFREDYPNLEDIYLEPGEAVALDAGILVTSVLDIVGNGTIAILDFSPEAHLNDIVVAPFDQEIVGAGTPDQHPHRYTFGSASCAAGDVLGDYSFPRPLKVGDRLVLRNMAIYSMVKTSTFCGVKLPDITVYRPGAKRLEVVRRFGYEDFKTRLS